jgi:hypothetical protein
MVDLTLGAGNLLNLPAGLRIVIGHSVSSDTIVGVLAAMQGNASGLSVSLGVGSLAHLRLGPTPESEIGCLGGTNQASLVSLRVPGLVDAGLASTSATAAIDEVHDAVAVVSSATVTSLSLFGGLIRVGALEVNARAAYGSGTHSAAGDFSLVNLSIAGVNLVPRIYTPDMRLNLPGLGYMVVHETVPSASSIGYASNGLDIVVAEPNNHWHLAVGLHIIVAHVDAGLNLF